MKNINCTKKIPQSENYNVETREQKKVKDIPNYKPNIDSCVIITDIRFKEFIQFRHGDS